VVMNMAVAPVRKHVDIAVFPVTANMTLVMVAVIVGPAVSAMTEGGTQILALSAER
jgi:hypothetical protein